MGKQRHHRRRPRGLRLGRQSGFEVVAPSIDAVVAAAEPFLADPTWRHARRLVLPVFERARPMPFGVPEPVSMLIPPGVTVGFGIDIGPAVMRIGQDVLEQWGVGLDELGRTAIDNLADRVIDAAPYRLIEDEVAGAPITAYQSREGWASTLVLVPELLRVVFGPEPRLFVAPCRDLLIGLPDDVDRDLATELSEAFESADPNGLCLEGFLFRDGRVSCTPLARAPFVA